LAGGEGGEGGGCEGGDREEGGEEEGELHFGVMLGWLKGLVGVV